MPSTESAISPPVDGEYEVIAEIISKNSQLVSTPATPAAELPNITPNNVLLARAG